MIKIYIAQIIMMLVLINIGLGVEINNEWINSIDPYGRFQWYFRYWLRRSLNDQGHIARWKEIVSRFKGKLIKMIKDVHDRFDDYSILPKIKQILLHQGYKLVESDLL